MEALEKEIKLYPHGNPSVYNCNNCDYLRSCKAIRIEHGINGNALRNYFCFEHSHFYLEEED